MKTNKEVFKMAKEFKKFAKSSDTRLSVRILRANIRAMCREDIISPAQRDYLSGTVLKYSTASNCISGFYVIHLRKYNGTGI